MTITTETARSGPYVGDGSQTVFAYGFKVADKTHLTVTRTTIAGIDFTLTVDEDYSVSGVSVESGGNVTLGTAPAVDETITITRNEPFTQSVDIINQGAFVPRIIERAFDDSVKRDQQLAEELSRTAKLTPRLNFGAQLYNPVFDKQTCVYDSNDWHYAHQPSVHVGIDDQQPANAATNPNVTVAFNSSPDSEVEDDIQVRKIWVAYSSDSGATFTDPVSAFDDPALSTNEANANQDMGNAMVFHHPDNKEWISWNHPVGGAHGGPIVAEMTELGGDYTHFRFCQDTQNPQYIKETQISGSLDTEISETNRTHEWLINGVRWRAQIQDWYVAQDGTIFAWLTASDTTASSNIERAFSMWHAPGDPTGRWEYGPFIPLGNFIHMENQFNEWSAFEIEDGGWMAVLRNTKNPGEGPDFRGDRHGLSFSTDGKRWSPIQYVGTENHEERMQGQRWSEQHQLVFLPDHPGKRRNQAMQIRRAGGGWTSSGFTISTEGDKPEDDEWRQIIDTDSSGDWEDPTEIAWAKTNCTIALDNTVPAPAVPSHINTAHGIDPTHAYLWTADNGESGVKTLTFAMDDALETDQRADVYLRFHCFIKATGQGNIGGLRVTIISSGTDTVSADFMLDGTVGYPAGSGTNFGDVKYAYAFDTSAFFPNQTGWVKCVGIIRPSDLKDAIVEDVVLSLLNNSGEDNFTAGANDKLRITDIDITWGRRAAVMSGRVIPEQGAILAVYSEGPETFPRTTSNGSSTNDGTSRNIHFKRITVGPAANKLNVIPSNRARELFHDPQNTWSHDATSEVLTLNGLTHAALDIGGGRTLTSIPFKLGSKFGTNPAPIPAIPVFSIGNQRDRIVATANRDGDDNHYLLYERVSEQGGLLKTGGRSVVARRRFEDLTEWSTIVFLVDNVMNEVIVEGEPFPLAPPYTAWLGDAFYTTANEALADSEPISDDYSRDYDLKNTSYGSVGNQAGAYARPHDVKFAPNLLLNGGFNYDSVNEGGTYTVSSDDANTLDGWAMVEHGNATYSVEQVELSDDDASAIQGGWRHCVKIQTNTVSTSGNILFGQDFDGVRSFNGKLLMVSFDMWDLDIPDVSQFYYPIAIVWRRNYGTNPPPPPPPDPAPPTPTPQKDEILTTLNIVRTPRRYTTWLQIPRMPSSYTLGTNGDDFSMLLFAFPDDAALAHDEETLLQTSMDIRIGRVDLYEGLSERIWTEPDPYLERTRIQQILRVFKSDDDRGAFINGWIDDIPESTDQKFLSVLDYSGMIRPPNVSFAGKFRIMSQTNTTNDVGGGMNFRAVTQTGFSGELRHITLSGYTFGEGATLRAYDTGVSGTAKMILDARRTDYSP